MKCFVKVHMRGVRPGPGMGGGLHWGSNHDRRVCHLPRAELLPRWVYKLFPSKAYTPNSFSRRVGGLQGARYPGLPQNARDGHGEVLYPHWDLQPGKRSLINKKKNLFNQNPFVFAARGLWSSPSDQAPTIRRKKLYHGRKFIWIKNQQQALF